MKFHHVGVFTNDLDEAIRTYERLGHSLTKRVKDKRQKVEIALMQGDQLVELVRASEDNDWVRGLALGPYHTCYEVRDLAKATAQLYDFKEIRSGTPAAAFDDRRVCFLWSPAIGLLELLESKT